MSEEAVDLKRNSVKKFIEFGTFSSDQKAKYLAEIFDGELEQNQGKPTNFLVENSDSPSSTSSIRLIRPDSGLYTLKLPLDFPIGIKRIMLYFISTSFRTALEDLKKIPAIEGRFIFFYSNAPNDQDELFNIAQNRDNKYIAPSSKHLRSFLFNINAKSLLLDILVSQLSLSELSPYQINGGVNNEDVFFGRHGVINHITNRDSMNYLVVGGRQMGKSSLLKALKRRYAENAQVRVFYQTLSNETLIPHLMAALDLPEIDSPQAFAQTLEAQLKAEGKRYIFLIDEADLFIAHEQVQGYPILSVFRRLSEQGQCSFILAGFWQLYQHAVLDYQSPLRNFGEVLEVGALEQDACEQLATKPMQNLNLSYANHALVQHLISQCGQRANLIAYVCDQIIKQLEPSQRVIEVTDIHRVLQGRDLQKRLAGWSVGIGEKEQAYDRLVVYSTIQQASFTIGALMQDLEQQGAHFDSSELEQALSRLELAFVLKKTQNRYCYCVPLFVEYMCADEVEVKRIKELKSWT